MIARRPFGRRPLVHRLLLVVAVVVETVGAIVVLPAGPDAAGAYVGASAVFLASLCVIAA